VKGSAWFVGFCVLEGAAIGALVVALPAALVWGHHGPDWPLIPLAFTSAFGALIGWRVSRG